LEHLSNCKLQLGLHFVAQKRIQICKRFDDKQIKSQKQARQSNENYKCYNFTMNTCPVNETESAAANSVVIPSNIDDGVDDSLVTLRINEDRFMTNEQDQTLLVDESKLNDSDITLVEKLHAWSDHAASDDLVPEVILNKTNDKNPSHAAAQSSECVDVVYSNKTDSSESNEQKIPESSVVSTESVNINVSDVVLAHARNELSTDVQDEVVIVPEVTLDGLDNKSLPNSVAASSDVVDVDTKIAANATSSTEKVLPESGLIPSAVGGDNSNDSNGGKPSTSSEITTDNDNEIIVLPGEVGVDGSDDKNTLGAAVTVIPSVDIDIPNIANANATIEQTPRELAVNPLAGVDIDISNVLNTSTSSEPDTFFDVPVMQQNYLTSSPIIQHVQYIIPASNLDDPNEKETMRIIDIEANYDEAKDSKLDKSSSPVGTIATVDSNLSSDNDEAVRQLDPTLTLDDKDKIPASSPSTPTHLERLHEIMKRRQTKLYLITLFIILLLMGLSISLSIHFGTSNQSAVSPDTGSTVSPSTSPIPKPIKKPFERPTNPVKAPVARPTVTMQPLLINAGSENSVLSSNDTIVWYPDQYNSGGIAMERDDCDFSSELERMSCTYRIFRDSSTPAMYNIPLLQTGMYNVTLYFMEPYFNEASSRIFDILLQGSVAEYQFDIFAATTEKFTIISKSFPVNVNNSQLTIEFKENTSFPLISGIEVTGLSEGSSNETTVDEDSLSNSTIPSRPTYEPGNLVTDESIGLRLSVGLAVKVIAKSGQNVMYLNGSSSIEAFHRKPDAAGVFLDTDPANEGGYIYVSNSEVYKEGKEKIVMNQGGVGALTFDKDGNVIEYRRLLGKSTANCGGGKTPWASWISCEEHGEGEIYQIDPKGIRPNEKIYMGSVNKGQFESFAYDIRNKATPRFFVTKDDENGEVTRL
jgi:Malectin domain/Bacterial protein of unknown function (DUF839)